MKKIVLIVMMGLLFNSCSKTINRWNNTMPKEYLEVYGEEDLPLTLKAKGLQYRCVDLVYSSVGHTKKCYVEKNSAEKIEGFGTRLYETSKMALLDTGENIMIFGMLMLCGMSGSDCRGLDVRLIKK